MKFNCSCCAVLTACALLVSACESTDMFGDIGANNDMTRAQELSRENRPMPKATELPPGLGEDLPTAEVPASMPASMATSSP
jgi:hypothetical protein